MGQLNGFGSRRGPRGEQHHRDVVGVGKLGGGLGGTGRRDELLRLDDLLPCAGDHVAVFGVGHDERLGQAVDQLAQAVGAQAVVERRERHTGAR